MSATKAARKEETQAFDPTKMSARALADGVTKEEQAGELQERAEVVAFEKAEAITEITIRIPVGPSGLFVVEGYATKTPEIALTSKQAAAAKLGACVVSDAGGRCPGGIKRTSHGGAASVENHNDFIRFLLEAFADEVERELGESLVSDFGLTFR